MMSSTKSMTGHLLGAAGAIEAIFAILAIRDQVAPPTINLDNPAAETQINLAPMPRERGRSTSCSRTPSALAAPMQAGSSMLEIVELMQSGKSILHAFTVPGGQTVVSRCSIGWKDECLKATFLRRCRLKAPFCPRLTSFPAAQRACRHSRADDQGRRPARSNRSGPAAILTFRSKHRKSW
jgi:hypothetical protein